MALALCHVNIVCRSHGRSAVAAAAYRAGEKIKNEYTGKTHNYSRKQDVIYAQIMTPNHAPEWMHNRSQLWNSVESGENRKDAQLARGIMIALPMEHTQEQNIALVKDYARLFVEQGMIVDIAVHDRGDGNPHAHLMLTMRPITHEGKWGAKSTTEYVLDDNGDRIKLPNGNYKSRKIDTTDWNKRENVELWRDWYANITNKHLELNGYKERINPHSYEQQGLERTPTRRLHRKVYEMEKRGIQTPQGDINRKIIEENRQRELFNRELANLYELQEQEQARQKKEALHHDAERRQAEQEKTEKETPPLSYTERYRQATRRRLVRDPDRNRRYDISHQEADERRQDRGKNGKEEPVPHHQPEPRRYEDRYKQPVHHERKEREQEHEKDNGKDHNL